MKHGTPSQANRGSKNPGRSTGPRARAFANRFEQSPSKVSKTLVSHFSTRRVGTNPHLVIDLNIIGGRVPIL